MKFNFDYKEPKVVAEIGCNHMGDFEIAKELIKLAKDAGAGYVKFQKRDNDWWRSIKPEWDKPHPNPWNSYGDTYYEHRVALEFTFEQHAELKKYCEEIGIVYSTSVWDTNSARGIIELNPEFIKVPSACNTNFEMLKVLRDEYKGQVQLSVGMTTREGIEEIVKFFEETNQAKDRLMIYSCTSGYPVPPEDVALLEINYLYEKYGDRVNEIGFSGHHLGIALDVAAYTLGARWIERHFTKNRAWKGTDHAASLEPQGLQKLCRDLNNVYKALKYKEKDLLDIEEVQRKKLKAVIK